MMDGKIPPLAPLSLIERLPEPYGVALYLGDRHALSDPDLLQAQGITTVINCAVNLDVNLVDPEAGHRTESGLVHGSGRFRYYKIGLIDGAGNPETMLLAGYFLIRGALGQVLPQKATYPRREYGNVLINCRGGRSRSVVLAALTLHHLMRNDYPTLDSAITRVRLRRNLHPDEYHKAPKPVLAEAARRMSDWIDRIGHTDPERPAALAPLPRG